MFPVPAHSTPKQQENPMGEKQEPNMDRWSSLKCGGRGGNEGIIGPGKWGGG